MTAVVGRQDAEVKRSLGPCGSTVTLNAVLSRLMLVLAIKPRVLYWLMRTVPFDDGKPIIVLEEMVSKMKCGDRTFFPFPPH